MGSKGHKIRKLSDWHRAKSHHHRGMLITVSVVRTEQFGLVCRLSAAKSVMGIIKRNELSWDIRQQDPACYYFGQMIDVEVLGYDDERWQIVLSKKKVDAHPTTTFAPGKTFTAEVSARHEWGLEVHLEGGVYGRLNTKEMPNECDLPDASRLQAGDSIPVEVIGHDPETSQPLVSLNRRIAAHQHDLKVLIQAVEEGRHHTPALAGDGVESSHFRCGATFDDQPLHVLLADDNNEITSTTKRFLEDRGHTVIVAGTIEETKERVRTVPRLDVVLLDLQFGPRLITSEQIPEKIHSRFPSARILLYTGNGDILSDETRAALNPHLSGVMSKLLPIRSVYRMVMGQEEANPLLNDLGTKHPIHIDATPGVSNAAIVRKSMLENVAQLAKAWPGSSVLVLNYSPDTDMTSLLAHNTRTPWRTSPVIERIHTGDLMDVLVDKEDRELELGSYLDPQLRGLMTGMGASYVRCSHIDIEGFDGHLVCLHFSDKSPTPLEKETMSNAISRLLLETEKSLLDTRIQRFQQETSAGALMLGMTHEFKQMLAPIQTRAANFAFILDSLETTSDGMGLSAARIEAAELEASIGRLTDIIYGFLGMSQSQKTEERPLQDVVIETVNLCKIAAEQYHVCVVAHDLESLPCTPVLSMLQQAVMNLVINAVQHTALTSGLEHRVVQIHHSTDQRGTIMLRISDNGYGIAAGRRLRLFRMFETTRPTGFGLGLYLTKQIIERIGGRVQHAFSTRYWNNSFEIILPPSSVEKSNPTAA